MKRQAYILITVLLFLGCSGGISGEEQTSSLTTAGRDSRAGSPRADSGAADAASSSLENAAGSGALTGVLLLKTEDGFQPVADVKLAIGETLSDDEGTERVVAYDPSTAPITYTDASGRFMFEDLESGRYGLILDIVMSSFLLYQEGTLDAVLFEITDGEMTDLGNLEYSDLPLPQ
ncbi:MAG: hypothetical protein F4X14_17670 [Caldilineaceae bacterium SB0661_bin_32]|uniref:Uncharacterized protein n=1 Tax=Caldilineaceae bacterium SB0661_bin_32 TaxID=2605255 RepID=A0A6B1DAN2_9CHLR|nr:hypothetical protein [Caldilineaceae bacterium SB0661_bin_32]